MSQEFNLSARFDVQGAFWPPESPEGRFTGRLTQTKNGIELTTSPVLKGIESFTDILDPSAANIPVLHGFTTQGHCTLFWLQSPKPDGLTDFRIGESLTFRQFRVGLCVFGLHVPGSSTPFLDSASFSYSGLNEWIPVHPDVSETSLSISLTHSKAAPPIFDVCARDIKSRIFLDVIPHIKRRSSEEYATTNHVRLVIEPSEPKSIEWMLVIGYRFEHLFSLLLGISVSLRSVAVKYGTEIAWLTRRVRQKVEKPDRQVWIRCGSSHLVCAVLRWLSTPEEFRSLENLIYGTIRNSSLFVETEFLSLAQAIESFHRLTDTATVTRRVCFEDILTSLRQEIDILCGGSKLSIRLQESIEHANDPNFRARIESLLARVKEDQRRQLIGDEKEFEQILRQTRNYLTHPGIKRRSKVLTKTRDLFLLNQKLHAFLRFLMLIHIGFPAESVFEPVLCQSRKWR